MSNSRFRPSNDAIEVAKSAFQTEQLLKQDTDFEIYEVPPGDLDNMALLLFAKGKDFGVGEYPEDLLIPVKLDDRLGYLWKKKAALKFRSRL